MTVIYAAQGLPFRVTLSLVTLYQAEATALGARASQSALDVNGVAFALPDVEITAGAVDPTKTLVQGQTPTLATVGDKSVLHLTLRDKNSNQVKVKDAANVAAAWTGSRFQSSEKGIKEKDVYPIPVSGVAVLPTGVVEMRCCVSCNKPVSAGTPSRP